MRPFWRLTAVIVLLLLLGSCLALLVYLRSSYLFAPRPPAPPTAVQWPNLPTPVQQQPNWQSFTAPDTIADAVLHDGLLWAATDGGVIVWQWSSGHAVKFTTEHGLAENVVTAVAVGADGALWFGTQSAGISRYDGTTWQTFTRDDGLPSNRIYDLLLAADGQLWAATDKGIGQYDGRRWYLHNRPLSLFQLPSNVVQTLALGRDGYTVWAGTDAGVAYYDGRRWQSLVQVGSQAINDIRQLAITPDGQLWAASAAGLLRYDGRRWQLFSQAHALESEDVAGVTAVADGTLWLSYSDRRLGLTLFDPATESGSHYAAPERLQPLHVAQVLPDGLLLARPGMLHFVGDDGSEKQFHVPTDLVSQQLNSLVVAVGSVWAAGEAGISRFDGRGWQTYGANDGLPNTAVAALSQTPQGQLVAAFSKASHGLSLFNAEQDSWQTVACSVTGPPSSLVRAGLQTKDGQLWFATDRGVARFDGSQWHTFTVADGLPSDNVQALAASGYAVWAGTDAGLAFFDGRAWQWTVDADVRSLSSDANGALWYFTERELYYFQPADGTLTAVETPPLAWLYDQMVTEDGVWLATDTGIHWWPRLRPSGSQWQTFSVTDGLPHGRITAIAQTADGRLWAGTEAGLATWQVDGAWQLVPGLDWTGLLPITRLAAAADGSLLIGGYAGDIFRYRHNQFEAMTSGHYGDNRWPVSSVLPVGADDLWVAHFGGGISHQQEGTWRYVPVDTPLAVARVNSVAMPQPGQAWLGTDSGLLQMNLGQTAVGCAWTQTEGTALWQALVADWDGRLWLTNGPTLWQMVDGQERRMGSLALPLTAVANDGSVWHVSREGVVRYRDGRHQTVPFPKEVEAAAVQAIAVGADGRVWLGTQLGAYRYDGLDWQRFTAVDGLAANDVRQIAVADDGTVWLATAGGISRFRP